jgi:hypothetical protein
MITLNNISELQAYNGSEQAIFVGGYYSLGDGGGNIYYDVGTTEPTNYLKIQTASNRWYTANPAELDLRMFGVFPEPGTPTQDNTDAIRLALEEAKLSKKTLNIAAGNYLLRASTINNVEYIRIAGQGGAVKFYSTTNTANQTGHLLGILGPAEHATTSITSPIDMHDRRLYLANTSGISVGDLCEIASNVLWSYDNRGQWFKGENHIVQAVGSNYIDIEAHAHDNYTVAEVTSVKFFKPAKVFLDNVHFVGKKPVSASISTTGLYVSRVLDSKLTNISATKFSSVGIGLVRAYRTILDYIQVSNLGRDEAVGYGILGSNVSYTKITNIFSKGVRRAVDFSAVIGSGVSRYNSVDGFTVEGGGTDAYDQAFYPDSTIYSAGIGMHGPAEYTDISNGSIANVKNGITVRGGETRISDIKFIGKIETCISATFGSGLVVRDCEVLYNKSTKTPVIDDPSIQPEHFIAFGYEGGGAWDFTNPVTISNIQATGLSKSLISFNNPGIVKRITISDCVVRPRPATGSSFVFMDAPYGAVEIQDSEIFNVSNERLLGSGSVSMYSPNISFASTAPQGDVMQTAGTNWRMTIAPGSTQIIRDGIASDAALISIVSNSTTVQGVFVIRAGSATLSSFGTLGSAIQGSASSAFTGLATNKLGVSLLATGGICLKNTTSAPLELSVTALN